MADRSKDADQREQESDQADAGRSCSPEDRENKVRLSPKRLLEGEGSYHDFGIDGCDYTMSLPPESRPLVSRATPTT